MWGERRHKRKGQMCSGSGGTGAQRLGVQGRRDALLWAGIGCMGWGEGEVGCSVLGWEMVVLGEKGEVSGCWVIKKQQPKLR